MRYMLLVYGAESALAEDERDACYAESAALTQDLAKEGTYIAAAPLRLIDSATSVRVRDGKRLVTDGPFAETHEQLGGYFIVDTASLDDALAIAARIPGARWGTIEVRPLLEIPGLPEE